MSSNAVEKRVTDMWAAMVDEITKSMGMRPEGDEMIVMRACANVALRQQQAIFDAIDHLSQHWCSECGDGAPCSATSAEIVLRDAVGIE